MIRTLIPVTSSARPVFPNATSSEPVDVTIFNTSEPAGAIAAAVLYLSDDPSVSAGTGIPLLAGSNVTWASGHPCHVVTQPGQVGTIAYTDSASNLFDAGGVAQQLITQGLAADIAAQIALTGAPPIDVNTPFFRTTLDYLVGQQSVDIVGVGKYQSISIAVNLIGPTTSHPVLLQWLDPVEPLNHVRDDESFAVLGTYAPFFTTYRTNVQEATLRLLVSCDVATQVEITVTGSYKNVPRPIYTSRPSQTYDSSRPANSTVFGSVQESALQVQIQPIPVVVTWWLSTRNGRARVVLDTNGVGSVTAQILHGGTGRPLSPSLISTGPGVAMDVIFPNAPCQLYLAPAGGVGWLRAAITFEPPG